MVAGVASYVAEFCPDVTVSDQEALEAQVRKVTDSNQGRDACIFLFDAVSRD
jgi:hypothetical protein